MLAWEGFKARYYRTLFGPIWITASFAAFIAVKIFIFGELSGGDPNYFVGHVAIGYMVWTYIANSIVGGATAFISARNWILGVRAPYSLFIYETVLGALFNLVFVGLASFVVTMIYKPFGYIDSLWALAGLAVLIFSLFWVQLLTAVITVFSRDFAQLVQTVMRISFFLTPIIWIPAALGSRAIVAEFNPFTHYVALVRQPLLDQTLPITSYLVVGTITFLAMIFSLSALSSSRNLIAARV